MPENSTKVYVDWGKIIQIAMILAAAVALAAMGAIEASVIGATLGLAAGYVFGNGKSAAQGHSPAPAIGLRHVPPEPAPEEVERLVKERLEELRRQMEAAEAAKKVPAATVERPVPPSFRPPGYL